MSVLSRLALAVAVTVATAEGTAYDIELAKAGLLLSDAMYCDSRLVMELECMPCTAIESYGLSIANITIQTSKAQASRVLAALDAERRQLVLAFRGLSVLRNFPATLRWGPRGLTPPGTAEWAPGCSIQTGYYTNYLSNRAEVYAAIEQHWGSFDSFFVTGHSNGGAQAIITAVELATLYPDLNVWAYTYEALRVGDKAFADFAGGLPNLFNYRMTHHKDGSPRTCAYEGGFNYDCHTLATHSDYRADEPFWHPGDEYYFPNVTGLGYVDLSGEIESLSGLNSVLPSEELAIDDENHNFPMGYHTMWCCPDDGLIHYDGEGCAFQGYI